MATTYLHRYARFNADGSGLHYGALCWEGSIAAPVPPADAAFAGSYIVPMDGQVADWHRLEAEAAVHGHCGHAQYQGGAPHPQHPHVRVGGTLSWSVPPHPDVTARAAQMTALPAADLVRHFTGGPA